MNIEQVDQLLIKWAEATSNYLSIRKDGSRPTARRPWLKNAVKWRQELLALQSRTDLPGPLQHWFETRRHNGCDECKKRPNPDHATCAAQMHEYCLAEQNLLDFAKRLEYDPHDPDQFTGLLL